jgi:hypothetical protein
MALRPTLKRVKRDPALSTGVNLRDVTAVGVLQQKGGEDLWSTAVETAALASRPVA